MESEILVRVKYKNEMKFIPISMVDLTVTQFVHRGEYLQSISIRY